MRGSSGARSLLLTITLVAQLVGVPGTAAGHTAPSGSEVPERGMSAEDARALRATSTGPVRVVAHETTGYARLVGAGAGRSLGRPDGVGPGDAPERAARAFLRTHRRAFGLERPDLNLVHRATMPAAGAAGAAVRFDQVHDGVPVLAGELVVRADDANRVLSVAGEVLPHADVDTTADVPADEATGIARRATAERLGVAVGTLEATAPELAIFDRGLFGGPGPPETKLVWRTEVASNVDPSVREYVLVDADRGGLVLQFSLVHTGKDRYVCDNENKPNPSPGERPSCDGAVARAEGDAATGDAQVDAAYDHTGGFYDLLMTHFGRDSIDDAGHPLRSTVRWCESSCPMANAFWDGTEMYYGDGFAVDDVVGHELAHGLTQHTADLLYYYQSGAINESLSDLYGELYDLGTPGDDDEADRWLLGEDLGTIRNMADPPAKGDPDRIGSEHYHAVRDPTDSSWDNGGVHTNSGVNNKAVYLLVDGATFNGVTVTAIGADRTLQIYYEAQTTLLTSGSDYAALAGALEQACANLVGQHGITEPDCTAVGDAVTATEMRLAPDGPTTLDVDHCIAGHDLTFVYQEDVEGSLSDWSQDADDGGDGWFYTESYATSGDRAFFSRDVGYPRVASLSLESPITLPADAHLRFAHAWDFETEYRTDEYFDGGVVEYLVDGAATWVDLGPLLTDRAYGGTISTEFSNPLGGRDAFVATSGGYTTTRADLSTLAGESVRFRWRLATDESVAGHGWYLDDIEVYTCIDIVPPSFPDGSALAASGTTGTATTLDWDPATDNVGVEEYRVRRDGVQVATVGGATTSYEVTGLTPATTHELEVVAADAHGNPSDPLATAVTTPDTLAPTFPDGAELTASATTTTSTTLDWPVASDNVAITAYELRQDGTLIDTLDGTTTSHEVTGLAEGTTYDFAVVALDDAGNTSEPLSASVILDVSAPSFPDGAELTASATTATSATLDWPAASDDVAVAAYELRQDGTLIETLDATTTSHEVTGLAEATTYDVAVVALDGAGNRSDPLATSVTTADATAPSFPDGAGLDPIDVGADAITLAWPAASDNTAVDHYELTSTPASSGTATAAEAGTTVELPPGTTLTTASGLAARTRYRFELVAVDRSGNVSSVLAAVATTAAAVSPGVHRLAGSDRYETAARVSADAFPGGAGTVYVATGRDFPDALAAGPVAGVAGAPILLVSPDGIPQVTANELARLRPDRIVVLGGAAAVPTAVETELAGFAPVSRIAGANRYDTAAEVSRTAFAPGVDVAYVATGTNFPDALAGAAAAGRDRAPILLVASDSIPEAVAAELSRLAPGRIVVLGGGAVVSPAVETQLASFTDGGVSRLQGGDRYGTGAAIASTFAAGTDVVYVATGAGFPDALTGTPPSVVAGGPVVLLPGDRIPTEVADALIRLAPRRIVVLGGTAAITTDTEQALGSFLRS